MDASTLTDPDCLGPCEPGTSVVLEGLVWAESNNGMYTQPVVTRGPLTRGHVVYCYPSACLTVRPCVLSWFVYTNFKFGKTFHEIGATDSMLLLDLNLNLNDVD